MRILVGIAERGFPELLEDLDRLMTLRAHDLVLMHVVDTGARGETELARGHLLPRPIPAHRLRAIGDAERQAAEGVLNEAVRLARDLGAVADSVAAEGEPGRVMTRIALERACALVVVGVRANRQDERAGPHSIGHTARFVLDHSPCPILLMRQSP